MLTPGSKDASPDRLHTEGGQTSWTYSQAVKAAGLVFVSGTAPHDPANGQIKGATIQEQTRQCLTNIVAILEEAGSSLDKIVSVTIVLADEEDFAGMNEEWLRWFPANPPARQGAKLPAKVPGLKVSIAALPRPNCALHPTDVARLAAVSGSPKNGVNAIGPQAQWFSAVSGNVDPIRSSGGTGVDCAGDCGITRAGRSY